MAGLHTQFGADAATQVTVSWQATQPVRRPRVYLARNGHEYERSADADTASYTGRQVRSGRRGPPREVLPTAAGHRVRVPRCARRSRTRVRVVPHGTGGPTTRTAATATSAATRAALRRPGWRRSCAQPGRPGHRLDRGVHAPGGDQHGRPVQRSRSRHPAGVGTPLRPVRRRPRRLRPRAPLRALTPDPRSSGQPDVDPGARRHAHRRHRHLRRHGAHGDRWRGYVGALEPAVLRPAAVPGDRLGRAAGLRHREASTGLRPRGRPLVRGAQRGERVRLRILRRRPGSRPAA